MGDPLSIASGIAGLVTLADIVIERTYNTIKRCKSAGPDAQKFLLEVQSLLGILKTLHVLELQVSKSAFQSKIPATQQYRCQQMLEKLRDRLTDANPRAVDLKLRKLERTLKWPFTYDHTQEILTEIERYKTAFNLAVSMDLLESVLDISAEQTDTIKSVQAVEDHLCRLEMDRKRREVLSFFGTWDAEPNHSTSIKLREPGTGLWLTESPEFHEWLCQPRGKLWLYGIPGAGKTVLAGAVVEETLHMATAHMGVAYYYCDYKRAANREVINILASIAGQLAKQNKSCFDILSSVHQDPDGLPLRSLPSAYIMRTALARMLLEFDEVALLVDALDEANDGSGVARVLQQLAETPGTQVRLLLLSRDELDIRKELLGYPAMSIAARSSDLRLFVSSQIEERMRTRRLRIKSAQLKDEILDRLVNEAEGMFRWVVCQMDHLCELPTDADRRKALRMLPPDLNSTYARILERIEKQDEATKVLVQRVLMWLINDVPGTSYIRKITAAQLCQAISIEEGQHNLDPDARVDVDEILLRCSSLVRLSHDEQSVEIAHFTVEEYLRQSPPAFDAVLGRYHYDYMTAGLYKVRTCLAFLQLDHFRHMSLSRRSHEERQALFPFYHFAAISWYRFMFDTDFSSRETTLCRSLITSGQSSHYGTWTQALFMNEMLLHAEFTGDGNLNDHGKALRQFADVCVLSCMPPLHMACMIHCLEPVKWLLSEGSDILEQSPLGSPVQVAMLGLEDAIDLFMTRRLACESSPRSGGNPPASELVRILVAAGADLSCCLPLVQDDRELSTATLALLTGYLPDLKASGKIYDRGMLQYLVDRCTRKLTWVWFSHDSTIQLVDSLLQELPPAAVQEDDKPLYNILVQYRRPLPSATNSVDVSQDNPLSDLAHMTLEEAAIFACRTDNVYILQHVHAHYDVDVLCIVDPDTKQSLPFLAASKANKDVLVWMLHNGHDVNARNASGLTLLHVLAEQWDDYSSRHTFGAIVKLLLSFPNIDIEARTPHGETALLRMNIGLPGHSFKLLLDAGADITVRDSRGRTIWHKNAPFGNLPNFDLLMKKAQADGVDILRELTREDHYGESPLSIRWGEGQTLLENLLGHGLLEGLIHGSPVNIPTGEVRQQVLRASAASGLVAAMRQQLDLGTAVNSVDQDGVTALHLAASAGHVDVVQLLLQSGANSNARNHLLQTPLHCAAGEGHKGVLRVLLEHESVDIGVIADGYGPPIYTAALEGFVRVVFMLMCKGADVNACCGSYGSPRARLLTIGPRFNHSYSFALNADGHFTDSTALWDLEYIRPSVLHKVIMRYDAPWRFADINKMQMVPYNDRLHSTRPLYEAVIYSRTDLVPILMKHGALINLEAGPEGTPLMAACAYGRLQCVKTLVRLGAAEQYQRREELVTALDRARQHREVVHWLLVGRYTDQRKLDRYELRTANIAHSYLKKEITIIKRPPSPNLDVVLEEDWPEYLQRSQRTSNVTFIARWTDSCELEKR